MGDHFCHVCQITSNSHEFLAREMMYGISGEFLYFQCPFCKGIQQAEVDIDLSKYYPKNYYSFSSAKKSRGFELKHMIKRLNGAYFLGKPSLLGKMLSVVLGRPHIPDWVMQTGVCLDDKILDVGTGSGQMLVHLSSLGFTNLTGIDRYIEGDAKYKGLGVQIWKTEIQKHEGSYDLVMFHHSFEHIPDPVVTLKEAMRLAKPGGYILIRVPVAETYAWRTYGLNWVQFDAPRHLFLHTVKSIEILSDKVGLTLEKVIFDSTAFQFWGSEQYSMNIPLFAKESYVNNKALFPEEEMAAFEHKAIQLNHLSDGDQACFYLKRPS